MVTMLALQGDSLNNLEEGDKSSVIAARERLDVGVDKVLNRNESTLWVWVRFMWVKR